jgi:hypothetical protein
MIHARSETQAMERTRICGHVFVSSAQEGILLWSGKDRVELKMVRVVESMARIMSEQLKLTPRRANLAIRTRVLILCARSQHLDFLFLHD